MFTRLSRSLLISPCRFLSSVRPRVQLDTTRRLVLVDHHSKKDGVYPTVWLRDNCRCPDCFHASTHMRRLLLRHLDVQPEIRNCSVDDRELKVEWADGHRSDYSLAWLLHRSFTPEAAQRRKVDPAFPKPLPCGPDFVPLQMDFEEVMDDERQLLQMLFALKRDGFVLLNATPAEGALERLAKTVACVQETKYGVFFQVFAKREPTNLSHTTDTLGLHSDLPFLQQLPGIQILQCLSQTDDVEGGDSLLADCRHVGRILKETEPEAFKLLTTQKVRYWTYGYGHLREYHMVGSHPVLYVDDDGEVTKIVYSDAIRDSIQDMDPTVVEAWYRSLKILHDLMMQETFTHRLQTGQTAIFDNRRLVHGRKGYRLNTGSAERKLRGCYLPWDETESRLRRLVEKYGEVDESRSLSR